MVNQQACPKCEFASPLSATECPRCGVVFSKAHARTGGPQTRLESKKFFVARETAVLREPTPLITVNRILLLLMVVGVAWLMKPRPKIDMPTTFDIAPIPLEQAATRPMKDPCHLRSVCVYVYVTPWCPACRHHQQSFIDLQQDWKSDQEPGLKLIIGRDQRPAILDLAKQYPFMTYEDRNDSFARAFAFESVPNMVIVDQNEKVITSGMREGLGWLLSKGYIKRDFN